MTDPATTAPEASAATPEEQPASTEAVSQPAPTDVESVVSARLAEFSAKFEEERLKPLQRSLSERDEEIKKLKTASLSEDEREQLLVEEEQERYEAIEVENWLLRKAQENAKAAQLFEQILKSEPDEQFALLSSLVSGAAAPDSAQPEPELQVPDVDLHNPAGSASAVPAGTPVMTDGTALTKEFRERFLKSLQVWPTRG